MLKRLLIAIIISFPLFTYDEELTLQQIKSQQVQQVGKIHFSKWFFDVYDAELYTQDGHFNWNKPFLLKIHYLRNMDGKTISKHTVKEISYQHPQQVKANYQEYRDTFNQLIPDVQNGTNLYVVIMDENGKGYIFRQWLDW
ncbi:NADH dehydrogenase subunit 2 [Francisella orientalis str. Toba 04]|nr:hypothetical protein [Francisella orientalis]AFJ43253.1 NADH dehydrogenase subunit 2 [Francisella orientalis str. Toba 04]AHB98809.1 NADH dehydrogenase [Francisella orientalis LADL 07-285A]